MLKKTPIALILVLVATFLPALGRAQTGIPQGYNVMPYVDDGTYNDTIIQLNNLVIQGVSSTGQPGIIYASESYNANCIQYYSVSGAGSSAVACPTLPPRTLYQIRVDTDTVVLTRTRVRTSFANLAVGDHINVFGFLDPNSNFVHSLIVRDLDKPAQGGGTTGNGYIQINNVQVLSNPDGSLFYVLSKDYGCTSYGFGGNARGAAVACPMGMDSGSAGATYPGLYPAAGKIYRVQILPNTQVLDLYRSPISSAAIASGDYVNIYGYYTRENATVQALIVRDLSVPNGGGGGGGGGTLGKAALTVQVTDTSIVCIKAPCGLVDNVTVQIQKLGGVGYVGTTLGGRYTFNDLEPGTYTVNIYTSGKPSTQRNVTLAPGENRTLDITVYGWMGGGGSASGITVASPNGGENLTRNTTAPISWNIPATPSGYMSVGSQFDVFLVHKNISGDAVGNVQYTIARNVFVDFGRTSYTYSWNVGTNQDNMQIPDGSGYYIRVCAAGSFDCDDSNGSFSINGGTITQGQVRLTGIFPSSGYPGTSITLYGSGLTQSGNIVHFDMQDGRNSAYLPNNYASNGSLAFVAPQSTSVSCFYTNPQCYMASFTLQPGTYQVWVENANGLSNKVTFVLYSNSYIVPAQ
jgi:hypothetical protein